MTNRPVILGVVTTLFVAVGQANAQQACPAEALVGNIGAGFSCRLGNTILSDFSFSPISDPNGDVAQTLVEFSTVGRNVTVTFAKDGGFYPGPSVGFDFAIAVAPEDLPSASQRGYIIFTYTFSQVVSVPTVTTLLVPGPPNAFEVIDTAGPFSKQLGGNTTVTGASPIVEIGSGAVLDSLTNTFAVIPAPEPTSLSLFAIGLAGLGFTARRKRRN